MTVTEIASKSYGAIDTDWNAGIRFFADSDSVPLQLPEGSLCLYANGLESKWGFGDGSAVSEWWWDQAGGRPPARFETVLTLLVYEAIVKQLRAEGHELEVSIWETSHNQIRAKMFDGVQVNHYRGQSGVDISGAAVISKEVILMAFKLSADLTPQQMLDRLLLIPTTPQAINQNGTQS